MGIIAGGLADGSVCLWDPAAMLSGQGQPLLARMQKHTGAGAAPAGAAAGSNEITCVSWNRKVQHILASSSTNGTTVVWDLKRQKPVISFRDPSSQRRASVLQWNPEVATQLVVASDDDRSPTLQMWDLRNSVSPLKEFVGHSKGVLGMAWSQHDPSLLLSCAKDNRTICWDVHSTDMLCELPSHPGAWNFDVQWCPTIPGIFSTSSFDGQVGVHNLHACTSGKVTETVNPDFSVTQHVIGEAQPLGKAPNWMKRPCGVSFGFGGRLVSFTNQKAPVMDLHHHPGPGVMRELGIVSVSQVVTEHELVERSQQFEHAIAGGEKQTLQEYCASKAQSVVAAGDAEEAEAWSFLSLLFEGDGRRELLKRLGFEDVVMAQVRLDLAAGRVHDQTVANVLLVFLAPCFLGAPRRQYVEGSNGPAEHLSVAEIGVMRLLDMIQQK
ncbi:SEC31A protein [Dunaliella salina]|uniref:SEC31A protein n=1 Tax=Dunaliella salina TaxID=3046 RepID=A0ABQ7GE52_DUNSA|nr:SEC31A protein [Dunaliella salina]|eukprot:KAF5834001.1 SEC31A protein [Dunaliella salina]